MTARVVGSSRRNRSRNSRFPLDRGPGEPAVLGPLFGVRRAGVRDPLRDGLRAFVRVELRRAGFEAFFIGISSAGIVSNSIRRVAGRGWWAVWDSNPGPPA